MDQPQQKHMTASQARLQLEKIEQNVETIIRGKNEAVRMAMMGLLAQGHILFEDVPGTGKTTLAHCLASSLNLSFHRVQGTSDLLPSDILGVSIYDPQHKEFRFKAGPIFANVVLVDEINRATPKTQSALLEAMNTAQVSIDGRTWDLPKPFLVIATQNPIESQGTFPLPKSQLDRFMMRLGIGYPDATHEQQILRDLRETTDFSKIRPVVDQPDLICMQAGVREVTVDDSLLAYMVRLVGATRHAANIELGASPRAALALRNAAQARAYIDGRDYVVPEDIKAMAVPVLAHRLGVIRTFEESAGLLGGGNATVEALLEQTPVPI